MKINTSTDYEKFKPIMGNRKISAAKVKKLVADIEGGLNLLPYCPIVVYPSVGAFLVVDGQHRLEATKTIGAPVNYVICHELDLKQIARINSRSDKWTDGDFLDCYIKLGVNAYETFRTFKEKYHLVFSAAAALLLYGEIGSSKASKVMEIFRGGDLEIKFEAEANEICELVFDIFDAYTFRNDRRLIEAMIKIKAFGKCDFEVLKKKIKGAPMMMNKNDNVKEYMQNVEQIYNHRTQYRTQIF